MWPRFLLFGTVIVSSILNSLVSASGNIVCYYVNSNGYSLAPPESLDPNLCTHINYAFAEVNGDGNLVYQNENIDIGLRMYKRVTALTLKNKSLKVLLSIGGGGQNSQIFSAVAADAVKRANFIRSSRNFLETYDFQGLDIDWEKPTANDSSNFITLLMEIRQEFNLSNPNWLLTAALYPNPDAGYNVPELVKYLDFFNIMTYNYFGSRSSHTGQNAPLFASSKDSSYEKSHLNVAVSIQNWITAGAPKTKLNMGLAFYGRSFTLVNDTEPVLHAPVLGPGINPTATFRQICTNYKNWTTVWDDEQKNPYKYLGNQWIGYDDKRSIKEKVKYAVSENLAGVMLWHIGGDDIHGECGEKQGLLKIINEEIKGKVNLLVIR